MEVKIKTEPLDETDIDQFYENARQIIKNEFTKELEERESQVIEIQEAISNTQKIIQFLKYTASCDLYDVKEEKTSESSDNQTDHAVHPCIKKFLPNQMGPNFNSVVDTEGDTSDPPQKKIAEVSASNLPENLTIVRGTFMVKHQFVIGNVSKWIPPSNREDEATHKWMLYLRMKEKEEELPKLVKKVRYFLHDSYKPHDVIDVTTSPFHLTRRGWGEFPVRATIYFQHSSNKPVDVIHNLKLDYTFSGMQRLGNETVLEVNLIHDNIGEFIPQETSPSPSPKKSEPKIDDLIANDHDYCLRSDKHSIAEKRIISHLSLMSTQTTVSYLNESEALKSYKEDSDGPISEWYMNDLLKRTSNIYFFSTEACVRWLLKRWPLISKQASDNRYKTILPFTFSNVTDYVNANYGKRVGAEWYRSWKIKKIIQSLNLVQWTTKQIFLYSRMHGYSIYIGKSYFTNDLPLKNISTYTNYVDKSDVRQLELCPVGEEIDVETIDNKKNAASPAKKKTRVKAVSDSIIFVEQVSKDIGIRFGEQEIMKDVYANLASPVLGHVLKLFLEDLLRKSFCNAWLRNKGKNPGSLEITDILKCVVESPEFHILTNSGLASNTDN